MATVNLFRLARITGNTHYEELAKQQLETFAGEVAHYPAGYSYFMMGAYLNQEPPLEIVLTGKKGDPSLKKMIRVVQQAFLPQAVVLVRYEDETNNEEFLPLLKGKTTVNGHAAAYLCKNLACQPPILDADQLLNVLNKDRQGQPPKR